MGVARDKILQEYRDRIAVAETGPACVTTALERARLLSRDLGLDLLLKREDQQPVFSFKLRGAYNRIAKLSAQGAIRGVITASAGNHAQGVSLAASQLGLDAVIVMPVTTPPIKVDAVRERGARVVLHGDTFDEALAHSRELERELGYSYIHPFDDPDTIAGQATVAVEILCQHPGPIDAIFVCLGGGGLAAGIAAHVKAERPETRVIGVEPEDAACMRAAFDASRVVDLDTVGLFADGAAVKRAGAETYRLCRELLDDLISVSVDELAAAMKDVFVDTRTLVEPAGALAVAGVRKYAAERDLRGQTVVATVSGANINFDRLRHVVERTEVGMEHESLLAVRIPEEPGSFLRFCRTLGRRSITEFNYRYAGEGNATVFAGVRLTGGEVERAAVSEHLRNSGYDVRDLSHDDVAKLHVRHMIGGRLSATLPRRERLFRFRFPERPGALVDFLTSLPEGWDITLFHYRNHGSAFGRVLAGLELPDGQEAQLEAFLAGLKFETREENDSEAYRAFLA